jgi:hypothetical protein
MLRRISLSSIALFLALAQLACDDNPTGACITGTGLTAHCGDDFTAGQCALVNGDEFFEGKTCKELGFHPN